MGEEAVEGASPGGRRLETKGPPAQTRLAILEPEKARVGKVLHAQALGEEVQAGFRGSSKRGSIPGGRLRSSVPSSSTCLCGLSISTFHND